MQVGQEITFGRPNGEKTKGTILKINKSSIKVRQDEARGIHKIGTVWKVHPSMCSTNIQSGQNQTTPSQAIPENSMPDRNWILSHKSEIEILANIYGALSPEALSCDGEVSYAHARQQEAKLRKKLQAMFVLIERSMDEITVYECLSIIENSERADNSNILTEM